MQTIKTECSKEVVQAELQHLKSAFEGPRLYMVGYFSDFIYNVDMECQLYLAKQEDQKSEASIQAWDDQSAIVDAIKLHETACFAKMPTNEFDEKFGVEMEARIKDLEVKMERIGPWGEHEWWEMSYEVQDALLMLQRRVFMGKGLKFVKGEKRSSYGETIRFKRGEIFSVEPFGYLVLLEDDFIREVDFLKR